jgi:hypothetical protein
MLPDRAGFLHFGVLLFFVGCDFFWGEVYAEKLNNGIQKIMNFLEK